MKRIEKRLIREGFYVANVHYPSTKYNIETLSKIAIEKGLNACNGGAPAKIHFVTHSLGGILVRYYLANNNIRNLGRTVMLSPPNKGSEVVDKLKHIPGFGFFNGPAARQLGTDVQSIPRALGAANFEAGVIAGTKSINFLLSMLLPSENDGKVSLESAHLENEKDFIALPVTHPFIMKNEKVLAHVVNFIKHGVFIRN